MSDFSIRLQEWAVRRRAVRARYNFVLGGTDSHYFGHRLVVELRWAWLDPADRSRLNDFLAAVRQGRATSLELTGTAPDYALGAVDIDEDEFLESEGEYFPTGEVSCILVSKTPQGAAP